MPTDQDYDRASDRMSTACGYLESACNRLGIKLDTGSSNPDEDSRGNLVCEYKLDFTLPITPERAELMVDDICTVFGELVKELRQPKPNPQPRVAAKV